MPKPAHTRRLRQDAPAAAFRSGVSRPAMWRVMEIHKIVLTGKHPNCSTLAKEIEVTPKTIQRDVSFMRDQLGLPLEYHVIRRGYGHFLLPSSTAATAPLTSGRVRIER